MAKYDNTGDVKRRRFPFFLTIFIIGIVLFIVGVVLIKDHKHQKPWQALFLQRNF